MMGEDYLHHIYSVKYFEVFFESQHIINFCACAKGLREEAEVHFKR